MVILNKLVVVVVVDLAGAKSEALVSNTYKQKNLIVYSRTSLIRTPKGQSKVSVLERCPLYRGHEYYVTLKAPLMVLSVL